MAKSPKRTSTEVDDIIVTNKVFKPEVVIVSKEELMSKLDDNGGLQECTIRCKVSDLPKNILLEILSSETFKIHDEDVCKTILSTVEKKGGDNRFDVLLNHQYLDALQDSTHMVFTGQGTSKNNRKFNILKFFKCVEDRRISMEEQSQSQSE